MRGEGKRKEKNKMKLQTLRITKHSRFIKNGGLINTNVSIEDKVFELDGCKSTAREIFDLLWSSENGYGNQGEKLLSHFEEKYN